MADLMELLESYGALSRVPKEVAQANGFVKVESDNGTQLMTKVAYERMLSHNAAKLEKEEKRFAREGVFGLLEYELPVEEINFAKLPESVIRQLRKIDSDLQQINSDVSNCDSETFSDANSALGRFRSKYEQFLLDQGFTDPEQRVLTSDTFLYSYGNGNPEYPYDEFNLERILDQPIDEIDLADIRNTFLRMDKYRSALMDLPEIQSKHDEFIRSDGIDHIRNEWEEGGQKHRYENGQWVAEANTTHFDNLINAGNYTVEDIWLEHIPSILESNGLEEIAAKARDVQSVEELRGFLRSVKKSDLPAYSEEKRLRGLMKDADERRAYSSRLSDAKKLTREQQGLVNGAADFVSRYEITAKGMLSLVNKFQQKLGWKTQKKVNCVYLDGRPNRIYDLDPGLLVGDCTEGKPLAFDHERVHNVKVRTSPDAKPIGSIYLVETKSIGEYEVPVWHIDAIQIPKRGNWEEGIANTIYCIAQEAQRRGVKMITVNDVSQHISNFDYVQEGTIKYHESLGETYVHVDLPDLRSNDETQSHFQGSGNARVLWKSD